jgi:2-polyprenyl-6-methoxyphenol hydroxylase-like FAD-dependent oxidoreductase
LIAGGGIAGLAAAITLLQDPSKWSHVMVLEQDASSQGARIQGFSLGMSPLRAPALQEIDLTEAMAPHLEGIGERMDLCT